MIDDDFLNANTIFGLVNGVLECGDRHRDFIKRSYILFKMFNKTDISEELKLVLLDSNQMRRYGLIETLKAEGEAKVMYFGVDKGIGDPLGFRQDIEDEFAKLQIKILDEVSEVLTILRDEEGVSI